MFKILKRLTYSGDAPADAAASTTLKNDAQIDIQSKRFRHYAEEYLFLQESKAHKTYIQGLWAINKHLNDFFGDMPVASIRFVDVEKFVAIKKKKNIGVDHILCRFRAVMKLAGGYGERIQDFKLSKQDKKAPIGHAYSRKELAQLMWHARDNRNLRFQIFCSYVQGYRHSEIVKMHWEFIDLEKEMCVLPPWFLKTPRTNDRIMRLEPTVLRIMRARRRRAEPDAKYLFPSRVLKGEPQQSNCSAWKRLKKRTGLDFRFHDLRHTAVTRMAENRAPATAIGKWVGMSAKVVEDIYAHTDHELALTAMNRRPAKKLKIA